MMTDNTEKRLKANRELVLILATIVEQCPHLRFNQILSNYFDLTGQFYEEPEKTLQKVKDQLESFGIDI